MMNKDVLATHSSAAISDTKSKDCGVNVEAGDITWGSMTSGGELVDVGVTWINMITLVFFKSSI